MSSHFAGGRADTLVPSSAWGHGVANKFLFKNVLMFGVMKDTAFTFQTEMDFDNMSVSKFQFPNCR